jgi:hypothetical protein
MISLIICSRTPFISEELRKNISETIEISYELIVIDNSQGQYSIFQAYNLGVKQAMYSILCFMHDDICYHTLGWGEKVIDYFKDKTIGMIGIAGARYLSKIPTTWWAPKSDDEWSAVCQNYISTEKNNSTHLISQPLPSNSIQVVVLDGVWLCIKKEVFNTVTFDETNYSGYHFYDMDISLQIFTSGWNLLCIYDVLIEHFSTGRYDNGWIESARIFYDKWKYALPLSTYIVPLRVRRKFEYRTMKVIIDILISNNHKRQGFFSFDEIVYFCRYGLIEYIKNKL